MDRILAVSGSCSPQTEVQIAAALAHGFAGIDVDPLRLVNPATAGGARDEAIRAALEALERGQSALLFSARGPGDPRIARLQDLSRREHGDAQALGRALGAELGTLLGEISRKRRIRRVALAGGDTSGHLCRALGVEALEAIARAAPGSPLCRASSRDPAVDGVELVMKGGQVGKEDFFVTVKTGAF